MRARNQNLLTPRSDILTSSSVEVLQNLEQAVTDMKVSDAAFGNDRLDSRGTVWHDKNLPFRYLYA